MSWDGEAGAVVGGWEIETAALAIPDSLGGDAGPLTSPQSSMEQKQHPGELTQQNDNLM